MTPRQQYIVMDLLDQSAGRLLSKGPSPSLRRPYGYIYILDHPSWTSLVPIEDPPVGIPQLEDIHGFIAIDGSLVPHPAEYYDAPSNRLWFKSYRIAATNEA
ncbi:hypothetical protein EDB86DRAFT_2834655 [Lactarius hatsudake]|nr:hypothetical protein EDB86DRAFT_2834655 [Lactarius hatsudake]